MDKHELVLTVDYELFGNGTGDVGCCMIEPLEVISQLASRYEIHLIIFAEVCEIWAFEEKDRQRIENQLKDMIRRGHNIQLHLHPQWIDARKNQEGWQLNMDKWRLPSLTHSEIFDLIEKGKAYLETLLKPINPGYRCNWFRAGAWCIQPEETVIEALSKYEFNFDSSFAPGMRHDDGLTIFNFTSYKMDKLTWPINRMIVEKPILTAYIPGSFGVWFSLLKWVRGYRGSAYDCKNDDHHQLQKRKINTITKILNGRRRMLDFGNGSTFAEMKYIYSKGTRSIGSCGQVIMIGHTKTFGKPGELEKFIKWIKSR